MPRARARSDDVRKNTCRRALACRLIDIGYELSEIADHARGPSLDTLYEWLAEDSDFRARFDKAHDARRERLVESIVALADDRTLSTTDRRLRIDARKWRVALMDKEHLRNESAEQEAFDAEFIRRLEAGLPNYGSNTAGAENKASAEDDDRRRYETTEEEPEPQSEPPKTKPTDMAEISDELMKNGISSWTIKFPEEVGGEGATAGPPPDGWWK